MQSLLEGNHLKNVGVWKNLCLFLFNMFSLMCFSFTNDSAGCSVLCTGTCSSTGQALLLGNHPRRPANKPL